MGERGQVWNGERRGEGKERLKRRETDKGKEIMKIRKKRNGDGKHERRRRRRKSWWKWRRRRRKRRSIGTCFMVVFMKEVMNVRKKRREGRAERRTEGGE